MTFLSRSQWKHYLPALFFVLLAITAIALPMLTVFLVAGLLMTIGIGYSWVVYRIHQAQKLQNPQIFRSRPSQSEFWTDHEPTFRNVTTTFFRDRPFYRDVSP